MQLELQGLCATDDEPWGWLAYGHWTDEEFTSAINEVEDKEWGERSTRGPIDRGWGRWVKPKGGEVWDRIWMGDGWPIPFLNQRYTMVIFE